MKLFQRRIEDFVCENCGHNVSGSGYTNHCPKCLYSKHVDVNPGDRSANCGGMMKPIEVELNHGEYTILHKCIRCKFERKNKTVPEDNFNLIIKLSNGSID
ncbi:MAG: RNHCP domain-containing protein [Candidatus Doudnabacteria bacterium]|nr:RNHCP domain-containing protein [Candidatus Doudnabacteria bacterium]